MDIADVGEVKSLGLVDDGSKLLGGGTIKDCAQALSLGLEDGG